MRFRCSHCHHDHDMQHDSYFANPASGTLAGGPWFKENGLNHDALACLKCGTVHATTGAFLKAVFSLMSRPVSVKFYLPIERLEQTVRKASPHSIEDGLAQLNLPEIVVRALIDRGYINLARTSEKVDRNQIAGFFAHKYVFFCKIFEKDIFDPTTLEAFVQYAAERPDSENAAAINAFMEAHKAGLVSWDDVVERVTYLESISEEVGINERFREAHAILRGDS